MALYREMARLYREIFPFRRETAAFLEEVFPPGAGPLLDVGCGPGDQALALAERGRPVLGIDADPAMIEAARKAARAAPGGDRVRFQVLDMREIGRAGGSFGGAYCLGNVLPHLSREETAAFLEGLAAILEPGAAWVVQTVNWDGLEGQEEFRFPKKDLGEGRVLEREYKRLPGGAFLFRLRVRRGEEVLLEGEETLHPLRAETMDRLHGEAGFERARRWGDFRKGPFDPSARPGGNVTVYRKS